MFTAESTRTLRWIAEVITPLELLHILSLNDHEHKYFLLEFDVKDQQKVADNCGEERKFYMVLIFIFFLQIKS